MILPLGTANNIARARSASPEPLRRSSTAGEGWTKRGSISARREEGGERGVCRSGRHRRPRRRYAAEDSRREIRREADREGPRRFPQGGRQGEAGEGRHLTVGRKAHQRRDAARGNHEHRIRRIATFGSRRWRSRATASSMSCCISAETARCLLAWLENPEVEDAPVIVETGSAATVAENSAPLRIGDKISANGKGRGPRRDRGDTADGSSCRQSTRGQAIRSKGKRQKNGR